MTREQVERLRPDADYGCGDGKYWIPTPETLNELCDLALKGLAIASLDGWVDTTERLPKFTGITPHEEYSDEVLVHWPNGYIGTGQYFSKDGWYWTTQDAGEPSDADPTHWMYFPPPPSPPK